VPIQSNTVGPSKQTGRGGAQVMATNIPESA